MSRKQLARVTPPSNPSPSAMGDDQPLLVQVRPYHPLERFQHDLAYFWKPRRRTNPRRPAKFTDVKEI